MKMLNPVVMAILTILLTAASARAGEVYTNPDQHFSLVLTQGLVRLTGAEMAAVNGAAATDRRTPARFDAAFSPAGEAGHKRAKLPLVLIRYVPGRTSMNALADSYRADVAKAYASATAAHPHSPATTVPSTAIASDLDAPVVSVDEAAHVIASERRRPALGGEVVVKRETVFVGRDGVVVIDWSGSPAQADADLKPMLASFKFDPGFEYTANDIDMVKTAVPAQGTRRTIATVIVFGGAFLFLSLALFVFFGARRRRP